MTPREARAVRQRLESLAAAGVAQLPRAAMRDTAPAGAMTRVGGRSGGEPAAAAPVASTCDGDRAVALRVLQAEVAGCTKCVELASSRTTTVGTSASASVSAVEASWHAAAFSMESLSRWALPLYRFTLCLGPVIIATMGMTHQISLSYALASIVLLIATRALNAANTRKTIPSNILRGAGGIYLLFLTIMMVCKHL